MKKSYNIRKSWILVIFFGFVTGLLFMWSIYDFVKVRVRGIFPSSSELQFISSELVDKARRTVLQPHQYSFAPVIIGVDPAWTGKDALEIVMRQGLASRIS